MNRLASYTCENTGGKSTHQPHSQALTPCLSFRWKERASERGCLRNSIFVFFIDLFIPASLARFWPRSMAESFLPACKSCVAKLCAMAWASVARPSDQFREGEWCRARYLLWACSAWWGSAAIFDVTGLIAVNCNTGHFIVCSTSKKDDINQER